MASNKAPPLFRPEQLARAQKQIDLAMADVKSRLTTLEQYKNDYCQLQSLLEELPQKLNHQIMVPLGPVAFMPGRIVHSNEILCMLGDNWFAKRSASQAVDIAKRRQDYLDEQIKSVSLELKRLKGDEVLAQELRGEAEGDVVNIVEEYHSDEEEKKIKTSKESSKSDRRPMKSSDDFKRRLDELERLEAEEEQRQSASTAPTHTSASSSSSSSSSSSASSSQPSVPSSSSGRKVTFSSKLEESTTIDQLTKRLESKENEMKEEDDEEGEEIVEYEESGFDALNSIDSDEDVGLDELQSREVDLSWLDDAEDEEEEEGLDEEGIEIQNLGRPSASSSGVVARSPADIYQMMTQSVLQVQQKHRDYDPSSALSPEAMAAGLSSLALSSNEGASKEKDTTKSRLSIHDAFLHHLDRAQSPSSSSASASSSSSTSSSSVSATVSRSASSSTSTASSRDIPPSSTGRSGAFTGQIVEKSTVAPPTQPANSQPPQRVSRFKASRQ